MIRTRLLNVRESLLHFGYEVVREETGELLAEGESVHMVVDSSSGGLRCRTDTARFSQRGGQEKDRLEFRESWLASSPSSI